MALHIPAVLLEYILEINKDMKNMEKVISQGKNHKLTYETSGWRWKAIYLWIGNSMIHFSYHPTELDLGISIHKEQVGLGLSFISLHFDWWK